mmetsp:Transcript_32150/g.48737  ORF Transcript_32150/g.48737 Transcript_32150/m.48737 type:complete len:91 (+) Transcript_32150:1803-2075(+)
MVEKEEWSVLNDYDGLGQSLSKQECLNGFMMLPCRFPPTFKVSSCFFLVCNIIIVNERICKLSFFVTAAYKLCCSFHESSLLCKATRQDG